MDHVIVSLLLPETHCSWCKSGHRTYKNSLEDSIDWQSTCQQATSCMPGSASCRLVRKSLTCCVSSGVGGRPRASSNKRVVRDSKTGSAAIKRVAMAVLRSVIHWEFIKNRACGAMVLVSRLPRRTLASE